MHKKLSRLKVIVDLENKLADNNNIPVKNRIRHKADQDLFKKDAFSDWNKLMNNQ